MNNNYNFPVEMQPIFLSDGKQIDDQRAVVRTDTMQTLGIVSPSYSVIEHKSVIDSFREAGQKYNVKEKITLDHNGARMFYQMTLPKVQMQVAKGDLIQLMMIAKNSYNGWNSLQIIFGAFRLVCSNGLILGTKFMQFNYRHIGNIGGMRDENNLQNYVDAFENYVNLFNNQKPVIDAMTKKQLHADKNLFDAEKIKLPKYLLEEAQNSFETEKDHSVWGYYNALTFAVTHKMKKEATDRSIVYGIEAWKQAEYILN